MKRSNFLLRDIQQEDLAMIRKWRNSEHIRNNMYNDQIISWEEHLTWFNSLKNRPDSIYKLFVYAGNPIGVVSFTNIDNKNGICFWGFYIGSERAEKGSGSIMGFLGLEYAFEMMRIRKLCGEAFAFNQPSIDFHHKLGFNQEGLFIGHILKNEVCENIIRFALFREKWLEIKDMLANKLFCKKLK